MNGIALSSARTRHHKLYKKGFTIVELLIVIVIIAILAAITLVSYTGIADRAEQVRDVALVKTYIDSLMLYQADNGSFPALDASGNIIQGTGDATYGGSCLGPIDVVGSNKCGGWGWIDELRPYSVQLNNALDSYGKHSQYLAYKKDGSTPGGTVWYHSNYLGSGHQVIGYGVPVSQDCGLPNVVRVSGSTTFVVDGSKYTYRLPRATQCIIQLDR